MKHSDPEDEGRLKYTQSNYQSKIRPLTISRMSSLVLIVGVVLAPLISTVISSLLLLWWDRVVEFKLFVDELQNKLTEYLEINFEKKQAWNNLFLE